MHCTYEHMLRRACHDVTPAARSSDAVAVALAETFKVLGDATRVRILDALSRSELCVCDIARLLGLSESAVSHQLRLLRGMRLVRAAPRRPAWSSTPSTTSTSSVSSRRGSSTCRSARLGRRRTAAGRGAYACHLHRLRAARRVDLQGRRHGLPRGSRADRAAVQAPAGPRGLLRRPHGPAPAREVRRGEAVGRRRSPRPSPTPACAPGSSTRSRSPTGDGRARRRAAAGGVRRRLLAAGLAGRAVGSAPGARRSALFGAVARGRRAAHRRARRGAPLRLRSLDINVLMLIAAAGAVAARPVVRGGRRRVPVRRRAGARSADARARAARPSAR